MIRVLSCTVLILICLSCGKQTSPAHQEELTNTASNKDSITPSNVNNNPYSIDYNNKNQYLSFGSILGKPMDTIIGADTVWFYYQNKLIYTEVSENHYAFYKHIKHWPKLIDLQDGSNLYLLELMVGEPEGSEIIGLQFKNEKLIKKTNLKKYPWWDIDMSKDYTVEELKKIIGTNPL